MLKPRDFDPAWDFESRNRRPPRDPINAMLSFAYALLSKEFTVALLAEGLDPCWRMYHQPRHGRPALALDLMEPLRPLIADSAVITAVFKTLMAHGDHVQYSVFLCSLSDVERASLRGRLDQLIHARDDQVILVDLGTAHDALDVLVDCLGKSYNATRRVQVF